MDIKTVLVETISELERMRATIDVRLRDLRAAAWEMGCQPNSIPASAQAQQASVSSQTQSGVATDIAAEIRKRRAEIMEEVDKARVAAMAQVGEARRAAAAAGTTGGAGILGVPSGLGALDSFGDSMPKQPTLPDNKLTR